VAGSEKMDESENTLEVLNGLIRTCKDGEKGFLEAADSIENGYYQILFKEFARRRGQFASELLAIVRTFGGDPSRHGSVAGSIHRGWMNLKSTLDRGNDNLILSECERGEEAGLKNYEQAMKKNLPDNIRSLIQKQYEDVNTTLNRLHNMEKKL
jgi:uncharacterized protein (TIGR02284 family)